MQKYPVRPSHRANLSVDRLEEIGRSHFDGAERGPGRITVRFGAITALAVWPEGRELAMELTMDPKVDDAVARETILRFNRFMEETTGFSAKERAKRLRKTAGG